MLDTMNVWKIIMGEEKMPTETSPAHSTRVKSGETDASNLQRAIVSFNERRKPAVTFIRFSVNTIQSSTKHTPSKLHTVRPHLGEKIGSFCERL